MTSRDAERFWRKVQKQDGDACWLWTAYRNAFGYGLFRRRNTAGDHATSTAHRFSWEMHHGPIPQDLCVLHTCDNPACVRPNHLWLGTIAENVRDRQTKGREARGVQIGNAKLDPGKVLQIRAMVASGMSQVSVGIRFGVHHSCISQIVRGVTWRHVEETS